MRYSSAEHEERAWKTPRRGDSPLVVAGGVVVRGSPRTKRGEGVSSFRGKRVLLLALAGIAIAGAVLASAGLLGACSSQVAVAVLAEGGARITLKAEVPATVATKLRKLGSLGPDEPLFNPGAFRRSLAARPALRVVSASAPTSDSMAAELALRSLAELAADPQLAAADMFRYSEGPGWAEFRLRLARDQGAALLDLFPGINPDVLAALSPPALDSDPVSASEYRQMLIGILGEKALPALDGAALTMRIALPGAIIRQTGGQAVAGGFMLGIPLLDLLTLEKPIECSVRWAR